MIQGLQRRARDENGKSILVPQDMTYQEWKEKYVTNSNNDDIIYSGKMKSYRINKYQDKIMQLYQSNGNENMCILNSTTGELIGNITKGNNRTTVGLDTKTMLKMLTKSKNSIIMIHNHPENYSFSLTDIKAFNKFKQIDSMILLTDNYRFYLKNNNIKLDNKSIEQEYKQIEKQIKKKYNMLTVLKEET